VNPGGGESGPVIVERHRGPGFDLAVSCGRRPVPQVVGEAKLRDLPKRIAPRPEEFWRSPMFGKQEWIVRRHTHPLARMDVAENIRVDVRIPPVCPNSQAASGLDDRGKPNVLLHRPEQDPFLRHVAHNEAKLLGPPIAERE